MDENEILLESSISDITWQNEYGDYGKLLIGKRFKRMQSLMRNIVIVRIVYSSSVIDMDILDARSTFSDKIAKFGGTYGIWSQLTGCSFLGLIHLLIILIKIILLKTFTKIDWLFRQNIN